MNNQMTSIEWPKTNVPCDIIEPSLCAVPMMSIAQPN